MNYKIYLFFFAILGVAKALLYTELFSAEWSTFKLKYGKQYQSSVEETFRSKIFYENTLFIAKHNQLYYNGSVTYKLELNAYADLLPHEFADLMLGFNQTAMDAQINTGSTFINPNYLKESDTLDWRDKGAVTEVKNQGFCGSCWAFSSTGSLEAQQFRKSGVLISLSEQNLIDCSKPYGNHGCRGGLMSNSFNYIRANHGIDTEKSYPYEAADKNCRFNSSNIGATVSGYVAIPPGDETKLKAAVTAIGPISIAINANLGTFRLYSKGVYNDPACDSRNINHAVLIVGYGTESNGQNYWLVKNSWGRTWGDNGYIKMIRGKNICGIAQYGIYPLI